MMSCRALQEVLRSFSSTFVRHGQGGRENQVSLLFRSRNNRDTWFKETTETAAAYRELVPFSVKNCSECYVPMKPVRDEINHERRQLTAVS